MRAPVLTQKRAKSLRRLMSLPEVLIWTRIWGRGFRRQHPLGAFILDFYRASDRLCIEIDGQQHELAKDQARDALLLAQGVRTVRIPAADILRDPDAAAEFILSL
ncbi:endonuclease domain-containing protein [Brevundimonas sp.]|uniref:endonuclease domain-containing protein n=1 Tax=Brevundimonas sp. TaxID=1871086 RepID=UPI002FDAE5C4